MSLPAKAISLAEAVVVFAGSHPGLLFGLLLAAVVALQAMGVVEPLDWWPEGQEVR